MSTLSQLQVFNRYAYLAMTEIIDQKIDLFNAASQGTITLQSSSHQGDFEDAAFWKKISGLVKRRNINGSGAVAQKDLEHLLDTSVKVAASTPPVSIPPSRMTWIQRNPQEQGTVYGQQLAPAMMQDMLNTAITATYAALSKHTTGGVTGNGVVYDGTADTMTPTALVQGQRLFGDRGSAIRAWIMHSKVMNDLWIDNLANAERLFKYESINIISDPFGRVFVVSDSDSLIATTPTPDEYHTLGLVSGATYVGQNNDFDSNIETSNGDENILRTIQSEWTFNLAVKGHAWDKDNGGSSPNDAAIGTSTNWDKNVTSLKDVAGVVVDTQ